MATHYLQVLRGFNRNVRLYLLVNVFTGLAQYGIYMVLFNLYLLRLGYGPESIGAINSVTTLGYALFSVFAGALGRRWGIHKVMSLGLAATVAGLLALPLAESFSGFSRSVWLVATAGLAWLGASAFIVNGDVLVYSEAGERGSGHAFSILLAIWGLTSFAGSLFAGQVPAAFSLLLELDSTHPAPYRYSLLLSGMLVIPGLVSVLLMRPNVVQQAEDTPKASGAGPYGLIIILVVVQLLQGTGESAARTFFNVYLAEGLQLGTSGIGSLMAVAQLLPVVVALTAPLLLARWGNQRVFLWSSLGISLFLLPVALIRHWGAAGIGYTGIMAMAWLWRQPFVLHRMALVTPGWRPVVNGAANLALGLSFAGTALAGGYIIAAWSYPAFFLVASALTAAGAISFWLRFRPTRAAAVDSSPTPR